jgi:hypothetical protein
MQVSLIYFNLAIRRRSRCQQAIFQLLRHIRQDFVPCARDEYVILDSHTAPAWQVNAGLNGNDHPRSQFGFLADSQAGRLVNFQTRPVPQTVPEGFAESGFRDHAPRDRVDLFTRFAGRDRLDSGELCF